MKRAAHEASRGVTAATAGVTDTLSGISNAAGLDGFSLRDAGIGQPLGVSTDTLDAARRTLMSPFADSDQGDGEQVVVGNTGPDMDLWSWVTGQEQAEDGLSSVVDAVERNAGGEPVHSVELKSHGGENAQEVAAGDGGMIHGNLTEAQQAEFARLGAMVDEDGEILMAGCNVAENYVAHHEAGDSSLDAIAAASKRSVRAGVAIQLPFDGIEGSSVTVHPDGTWDYDTSSAKQAYDVTANGVSDVVGALTDSGSSVGDRLGNAGSTLWGMGSDYLDIGLDVVNGTQNAEGWKPPGAA